MRPKLAAPARLALGSVAIARAHAHARPYVAHAPSPAVAVANTLAGGRDVAVCAAPALEAHARAVALAPENNGMYVRISQLATVFVSGRQ